LKAEAKNMTRPLENEDHVKIVVAVPRSTANRIDERLKELRATEPSVSYSRSDVVRLALRAGLNK
jgi:hypothetical protein